MAKLYDAGVNYEYLDQMGVNVVKYQPWQLGLKHPDLVGKFVWYPMKGTLMYQKTEGAYATMVGEPGDYKAGEDTLFNNEINPLDADVTERVFEEMMKQIRRDEGNGNLRI